MGTVLIVLYILSLMIRLSGKIVGNKKSAAAPAAKAAPAAVKAAPAAAAAPAAKTDDSAVVAVIAAAVAAYLVVRPVTVSSAWSADGMLENTKKF